LRGNVYVRTLLIQGARSTLQSALRVEPSRASRLQRWIIDLHARNGYRKTLVAIANKHARMLWAMLVIVARAHHRCATRPFAKTQSVPSSAVAPAAIT
jgi:hypothetical protein